MDSIPTSEQYEWSENQAWTFGAEVNAAAFAQALDAVNQLTAECVVEITPTTLSMRATDPANVCAVDVSLDCIETADGVVRAGIDVRDLTENAPAYWNETDTYALEVAHHSGAGFEDTITVQHPSEGGHEAAAFDPASVRDAPTEWPGDDTAFQVEVQWPAPKARGVLGAMAEAAGNYVRLGTPGGENRVLVEAIGAHDGENVVEYDWSVAGPVAPGTVTGPADPEASQHYSADYLADAAAGLPTTGDVAVRFGSDQLLELDAGDVRYALAPREGIDA